MAATSAHGCTTTSTVVSNWLASTLRPAFTHMHIKSRLDSYSLSFVAYCIYASCCTFIMSVLIGASYQYFINDINLLVSHRRFTLALPWDRLLSMVVIGPLIETAISQLLLISLLRRAKIPNTYAVVIGSLFFSLWHLQNSLLSAINTIFLGYVLCFSYIYWLENTNSTRRAFEAALLIHAVHNSFHALLMLWQRV